MSKRDFSFASHALNFDNHIEASIPDYQNLIKLCISISGRFVQPLTTVIDFGCSTGSLLSSIELENRLARKSVDYVGIDVEPRFRKNWACYGPNIRFEVSDARVFNGLGDISFASSIFTIQFIPAKDKHSFLQRVFDHLVVGGSLFVAEKLLASTPRLQDVLTFPYYDFKRNQGFSPTQILNKERSLRGQMTLWTRNELEVALRDVGFREVEPVWQRFPFTAYLALK